MERKHVFCEETKESKTSKKIAQENMSKTMFSNPLYHSKLERQINRKISLTKALGIRNRNIQHWNEFSFRLDEKVQKLSIVNIETNKLNKQQFGKQRKQSCKPYSSAYYQMNKSYDRYFNYIPSMTDSKNRKSRCGSAAPHLRKAKKEEKLKNQSIKVVEMIRK